MKTQNKRFVSLKGHKGIRQDTKTGNYQARKYIDGKEYSESFSKISQALKWKNEFHPSLKEKEEILNESTHRFNGVETVYKFEDIWNLYREQHLPSISPQSRSDVLKRANKIAPKLVKYRMVHINAKVLDSVVKELVNEASKEAHNKRHSFDKELQTLRAILNWYKENYDAMFVLPILKRHYIAGTIKKKIKSTKKMTISEVKKFFEAIEDEFWRDFAEIHFFMAGRVQEPAGLQVKSVDFKNRILSVCDVSVWGRDKKFMYLKEIPKNGEERLVHLNDRMIEILKRRIEDRSSLCEYFRESDGKRLDFVFHLSGEPLTYRQIQHHYNRALKRAGLWPDFKATHILRKAMANIVRENMGLDAAQAVGGWKSRDVVEKIYTNSAPTELNKSAVSLVEEMMFKK